MKFVAKMEDEIVSEEDRLKLENELLLTKSKAQMINLYLDLQQKVEQLESIRKEAIEYINHATIGADSSPIEDSWLYNLYETRHILNKGEKK